MKKIYKPLVSSPAAQIPLYASPVSAGFPAPADDEVTEAIDLNTFLIHNKPATYLVRVQGTSLEGIGILDGDLLVVDASLSPSSGQIVVASVNGEFLVKRFVKENGSAYLKAENPAYPPLKVTDDMEGGIMGVVTGVVRKML